MSISFLEFRYGKEVDSRRERQHIVSFLPLKPSQKVELKKEKEETNCL